MCIQHIIFTLHTDTHTSTSVFIIMKLNSMIKPDLFDHKICKQVTKSRVSSVNCNEAPFIVVLICLALPTQITMYRCGLVYSCYKCTSVNAITQAECIVCSSSNAIAILFGRFFFHSFVSSLFDVIV